MKIENIKVKTVDKDKLIEFLNVKLKENEKLSIDSFAVYENLFAINTDCMFWEVQHKHINDSIHEVIEVDARIKKYNPDGSYSIRMDRPDFTKTVLLSDILGMAKEVNLVDFIRYNYNPRITSNQNLLMKYINASKVDK